MKPGNDDRQSKAEDQDDVVAHLKAEREAIEAEKKELSTARARLKSDMEVFEVAKGPNFTLDEIGEGKGIEMVTEREYMESSELAVFMNELVKINVHKDGLPGALPVIVVTVNGKNQAIIRGRDQWVKRKYVEALARSRITNYEQETLDPSKPENIQMRDITSLTYPFAVREDRNKRGARWLENIQRQP